MPGCTTPGSPAFAPPAGQHPTPSLWDALKSRGGAVGRGTGVARPRPPALCRPRAAERRPTGAARATQGATQMFKRPHAADGNSYSPPAAGAPRARGEGPVSEGSRRRSGRRRAGRRGCFMSSAGVLWPFLAFFWSAGRPQVLEKRAGWRCAVVRGGGPIGTQRGAREGVGGGGRLVGWRRPRQARGGACRQLVATRPAAGRGAPPARSGVEGRRAVQGGCAVQGGAQCGGGGIESSVGGGGRVLSEGGGLRGRGGRRGQGGAWGAGLARR
jgi:hypothetical protein